MEKTLQEQLDEVNEKLSAEKDLGSQKDAEKIAVLEQQQADILKAIMDQEQEAAHKVVIQEATEKAAYIMDNLVIEGLTVRELAAGEQEYQLLRIAVQGEFINQAEAANLDKQLLELAHRDALRAAADRELQLQRQNEELQKELAETEENHMNILSDRDEQLRKYLQEKELREDAESKRDAAVSKAEGLELMLQTKQEELELMRTEKAVGAVNAHNVINLDRQREEMKTLAEQIKASRIHVYNVTPDDVINPKNYTAKRADNDEEVTYNWTQKNKYIELKSQEEVLQFRNQHVQENSIPDNTLAEPDEKAPELIKVEVPEVTFPANFQVPSGNEVDPGVAVKVGQTLEEAYRRIEALEKVVYLNTEGFGGNQPEEAKEDVA